MLIVQCYIPGEMQATFGLKHTDKLRAQQTAGIPVSLAVAVAVVCICSLMMQAVKLKVLMLRCCNNT
jgi:hypothetical protein